MRPIPDGPETTLLDCPACGLPAEITDRFILGGAPGPVEHIRLTCIAGHWSTPAAEEVSHR